MTAIENPRMSSEDRHLSPCLVVGAGISGLSAALMLKERGVDVEVWEQDDGPGGLLAPVRFRGMEVDRGSHRVHREAYDIFSKFTDAGTWHERPRIGKLIMGERHVPYPPGFFGFVRGIGLRATWEMAMGFMLKPHALEDFLQWNDHRSRPSQFDEGFERFVVDRVGRAAYEKFYRPYVEKVWGESPSELSCSVAKQRMSTARPFRALLGDIKRPPKKPRSYFYPKDGMSSIIRQMQRKLKSRGVDIQFGRAANLKTFSKRPFKHILFSGQIASLTQETELRYRGLYLVYISMPEGAAVSGETFYLPESHYWFGRVSKPESFSERLSKAGETTLCVEIPEGHWGAGFDFVSRLDTIVDQLRRAGIVNNRATPIEAHQVYLPHVYPLYHRGWQDKWQQSLDRVGRADKRILPIGRQGLFLHCNMDHCISISIDAVNHLVAGGTAADWSKRVTAYRQLRVRD